MPQASLKLGILQPQLPLYRHDFKKGEFKEMDVKAFEMSTVFSPILAPFMVSAEEHGF